MPATRIITMKTPEQEHRLQRNPLLLLQGVFAKSGRQHPSKITTVSSKLKYGQLRGQMFSPQPQSELAQKNTTIVHFVHSEKHLVPTMPDFRIQYKQKKTPINVLLYCRLCG